MQKKITRKPQPQSGSVKKQTYCAPKLKKFGNISELTLTSQKAGMADNKGQDMNMTF